MSESLATACAAPITWNGQDYPIFTMEHLGRAQSAIPGLSAKERAFLPWWEVTDWMRETVAGQNWVKALYAKTGFMTEHSLPENPMDFMGLFKEIEARFLAHNRLPTK